MSKFTMQFLRSFIVSTCSFFWIMKISDQLGFSFDRNSRSETLKNFYPTHSMKPARIYSMFSFVGAVLIGCTAAEILSAIVQSIVVSVVAFFIWEAIQNNPIHVYRGMVLSSAESVKTLGMVRPPRRPVPLIQPIEVSGIDDGILILC